MLDAKWAFRDGDAGVDHSLDRLTNDKRPLSEIIGITSKAGSDRTNPAYDICKEKHFA
jgi:hypothetical protein